ncbi:HEAT repeat domain-containing protein [Burkholderia sp. Bp9012]|uniref:HEAT repeat domain-containing protein n=1 Tax=Burkholderia sp. Bp9012 TaxID=2184562 RepID=UPI000F5A9B68|nr:HEAT repeat domain-containing protein [Burkholderia sp. Bp9012]RQR78508.1 HEAT repeat domain-containing protein [Burkholderia sp. Bp9012]
MRPDIARRLPGSERRRSACPGHLLRPAQHLHQPQDRESAAQQPARHARCGAANMASGRLEASGFVLRGRRSAPDGAASRRVNRTVKQAAINTISMHALNTLHEQVEKFREWAALYPVHQRSIDWECEYGHWEALWDASLAVVDSLAPDAWTVTACADLLYAIARDHALEHISSMLWTQPDALLALARASIDASEPNAKWQLAARLGGQGSHAAEAEALLLRLVNDEDEYVRRRALLALGALKSAYAETLAERAWDTGHEYQRIAALWVLKDVKSGKLAQYVKLAEEDGREYVVRNARDVTITG